MSRSEEEAQQVQERFPRVSGDEPSYLERIETCTEFSPRERG